MRPELAALKEAGFTSYLIRPVRATSLAARFSTHGAFEPAAREPTEAASSGAGTDGRLSILVAEDNEINALLTRAPSSPSSATVRRWPPTAWRRVDCLAARAGRHALRSRAHGPAHAGHGRRRGRAPHQSHRGRAGGAAHADPRADRERLRRGSRRLPCRGHGRLPGQTARPRASQRSRSPAAPPRWRRKDFSLSLRRCRGPVNAGGSAFALPSLEGGHDLRRRALPHSRRSATSSTSWLSPFLRMRSARGRVGRMFSRRFTRLMRFQIEVAVAIASASDNRA